MAPQLGREWVVFEIPAESQQISIACLLWASGCRHFRFPVRSSEGPSRAWYGEGWPLLGPVSLHQATGSSL